MTTTAYPQFNPVPFQMNTRPYQDAVAKIANVYADSMRANVEQMWISSSQIIVQETVKAFMAASQSCMEALARNAASVQQQSFGRIISANQKAFEIMGQAATDTMLSGLKPVQ
jgi:hypothetical protein